MDGKVWDNAIDSMTVWDAFHASRAFDLDNVGGTLFSFELSTVGNLPGTPSSPVRYRAMFYVESTPGFRVEGDLKVGDDIEFEWNGTEVVSTTGGTTPAGAGADSVVLTFTKELGAPVADASVWITTDAEGNNVVAGTLQTSPTGEVTFLLDDGSDYYCWMDLPGSVNPITGSLFTADAAAGNAFSTTSVSTAPAEWYYANQVDVEDFMGTHNLEYASQQNADTQGINSARVLRAGRWSDAQINMRLKGIYPKNIPDMSDDDIEVMAAISVQLVIAELINWRVIQFIGTGDESKETIYKDLLDAAKMELDELFEGAIELDATRSIDWQAPQSNDDARDISGNRMYRRDFEYTLPTSQSYRRLGWWGGFNG